MKTLSKTNDFSLEVDDNNIGKIIRVKNEFLDEFAIIKHFHENTLTVCLAGGEETVIYASDCRLVTEEELLSLVVRQQNMKIYIAELNLPESTNWDNTGFIEVLEDAILKGYQLIETLDGCIFSINSSSKVTSVPRHKIGAI